MSAVAEPGVVLPVAVVIEDEHDVAHLLEVILSQAGFRVVVTHDGDAGVEAVRTYRPQLTTVDISLPGVDGLEATRRIREFSSTYIVMVTGLAGEDDIIGGFGAGADDYVAKPFRPRELRARFMAGLRRPPGRLGTGAPEPEPEPAPATANPSPEPAPLAGVRFTGEWVELRGLALNPHQGLLTVDGRALELDRLEFDLLEILLYSGDRARSSGDLAMSLRGETYLDSSQVAEHDRRLVTHAMASLVARLADNRPDPRWIEQLPGGAYRLVPPVS
ncbi:DNA-binding response OmpR family regulator [Nocardioides ginsengisegetis]|uniref:DNA-binding response OmpR family regulator n=1 Tax=Nocardioides ginsengisegetis TaxID=661491 RepID=A0A7W3P8B0_9ACTN|nr:response regulator transcription factor [Nocardioides ginsengisegetis]MBA8802258.1 DNA-binding response OmpR family regulator [Nocardioides ginsengisegetis]